MKTEPVESVEFNVDKNGLEAHGESNGLGNPNTCTVEDIGGHTIEAESSDEQDEWSEVLKSAASLEESNKMGNQEMSAKGLGFKVKLEDSGEILYNSETSHFGNGQCDVTVMRDAYHDEDDIVV